MWADFYVDCTSAGTNSGTLANPWTSLQTAVNNIQPLCPGVVSTPSSIRINIKYGGTTDYTFGTSNIDFGCTGTTSYLVWWRGYNTTPGDGDGYYSNTIAKPKIRFTTGQFSVSAPYQIFSGLDISGSTTKFGSLFYINSNNISLIRNRLRNLVNSTIYVGGSKSNIVGNYISTLSNNNSAIDSVSQNIVYIGNFISGGSNNISLNINLQYIYGNIFIFSNSDSVSVGGNGGVIISHNTIYKAGNNGIDVGDNSISCVINGNLFHSINNTGIQIPAGVGSPSFNNSIFANSFYNVGTPISNYAENLNLFSIIEGVDPLVNNTFTVSTTSQSITGAFPGPVENISAYRGYLSMGALGNNSISTGGVSNNVTSFILGNSSPFLRG